MLRLIKNAIGNANRRAIISNGREFTYAQLLDHSAGFAGLLLSDKKDLLETRVAFMVNPGFEYVMVQWAIWRAGGIAVPLCISYPMPSLQYVIEDTRAEIIVAGPEYAGILKEYAHEKGIRLIEIGAIGVLENAGLETVNLPTIQSGRRAMILYTSGTTNLPKGVVTTHKNIQTQVATLVKAWRWSADDHTLCVLPLHHVHGIINVITCALWSGATCEFLPNFSTTEVLHLFRQGQINVFMAVPTIYFKLISAIESLAEEQQAALFLAMQKFRLMVSGSAALPVSVMEKWHQLSGHYLLERYGMTEIGMGISNPYVGERRPGYIGQALPGVKVRLADDSNKPAKRGQPGEIQVKGKSVFLEYWGKAEATQKSFTADGWFKTGDVAVVEKGYYRILGRDSIDIIKSGGYKISALEIEEVLRTHPDIADCSVVGIPDEEWGEMVVAFVVMQPGQILNASAISQWLRAKIPGYKTPRKLVALNEFPRNAMGKVVKNELKKLLVS